MIEVGSLTAWIHTTRPLEYVQNKDKPCCQHTLNNCQGESFAEHHVIASGSSGNQFDICIWEEMGSNHGCNDYVLFNDLQTKWAINGCKKISQTQAHGLTTLNGLLLYFLLYLTSSHWLPWVAEVNFFDATNIHD
jgi:hypothetical protein